LDANYFVGLSIFILCQRQTPLIHEEPLLPGERKRDSHEAAGEAVVKTVGDCLELAEEKGAV